MKDIRIDRLVEIDRVSRTYEVFTELTNSAQPVEGIAKLAQMIEKAILTTPGSDLTNTESGGGILSLIATNVDPSNLQDTFAKVQQGIGAVMSEFQLHQEGTVVPRDEQLESLDLVDVNFKDDERLNIRILVTSKAGDQIVTNLP